MRVCVKKSTIATENTPQEIERMSTPSPAESGPLVRAEANLLRFPLFALHTKGLRTLDGLRCTGKIQRDGQPVQFSFTASRNTSTLYPGPLARSAHLAFLSILTEAGPPAPHPLSWTWRDLCRRMGIVYGGEIVRDLKRAITSTAGLLIQSESALFSKAENRRLTTREDALHLYDRVAFLGSTMPDGSEADQNYLWLSDWFRQNLDAFFSAPLDFALWKHLEQRSAIASRLYEFLLVNFYGDTPVLQFNYETLTQYLPVKAEKYLSSARRQMGDAVALLVANDVIKRADWCPSKTGLARIVLERGRRFSLVSPPVGSGRLSGGDESADVIAVVELRNHRPAEYFLVADFYRDYAGDLLHRPSPKELLLAKELIETHGVAKGKAVVTAAVKRLKIHWPEAKTFGAIAKYLPEAIADCTKKERLVERSRQAEIMEHAERDRTAEKAKELSAVRAAWEALPASKRLAIRTQVLSTQPRSIQKFPDLIERLCLEELARRKATAESVS